MSYQIHEVYYKADGRIACWTAEPVTVYSESLAGLREDIRHFLHACRLPVLTGQQFDGRPLLVEDDEAGPLNAGQYFEFMDRAAVATDYVYQFLGSHPLLRTEPGLAALYEKAEAALAELYQAAGSLAFEPAKVHEPEVPR